MMVGRAYRHAGGNMSEDNDALAAAYMAGRYDGRKQAEAEVARLTKERDWLAKALAEDGCPYLALWSDFGNDMRPGWCICTDTADDGFDCAGDPKECWKKEAARKAEGE